MSQEPHPRTEKTEPGSVPGQGPGTRSTMGGVRDGDRSEVPPEGAVPDDLAEAGEEQLKEGMAPGGRVAGDDGAPGPGDRS